MATLLEILILAIIQGVTEWLPISSSGHLVIVQEYLGLSLPVLFDVVLHLGSLIVVLVVFWKDVLRVLKAVTRPDFKSQDGKLGVYIVVGSIATAAVGFVFRDICE
jgi:undecaprenyl-diphosphatase